MEHRRIREFFQEHRSQIKFSVVRTCLKSIQAALTNYYRLDSVNIEHLFLTVVEAGKCKMKALEDLVSGERLPPVSGERLPPSSQTPVWGPHMVEREELSGLCFIGALILFMRPPPS